MRHDLPESAWNKSSYSDSNGGGNCVQTQLIPEGVALGDSKNPDQGAFVFTPAEWSAFVAGVKDGQFDLLS